VFVALRHHFAQDRQRWDIRDGAPFNHVAVAAAEQRLKRQLPEFIVRRDDEIGFTPKLRLRRFEQQLIEFASGGGAGVKA
jgi:hypothetical protein